MESIAGFEIKLIALCPYLLGLAANNAICKPDVQRIAEACFHSHIPATGKAVFVKFSYQICGAFSHDIIVFMC